MRSFISLFLLFTFCASTQALECTVGYDEPDAQGHLTGNPIIAFLPCQTKCLTIFVKTAQHPTGTIAASCASEDTSACEGSMVLDVNTWTEVRCCNTDRCNGPTGNFPWDGYDWATPRNPLLPTSTSTDTPTSTPTSTPITTNAPTTPATAAPGTILCTVGTSVPNELGGVSRQGTTQSCTQCYAIYTHSSFGPVNVGTISGGCASTTNRECDFQGTVVTQQGQWVEVKCCNSGNQCNSQDWGVGQYDWTTPRTSSAATQPPQPTTSVNPTSAPTQQPTTSGGNPTTGPTTKTPTTNPTGQPITGNNTNTLSSTGIYHSSATTVVMSCVCLMVCMMMAIMSMMV